MQSVEKEKFMYMVHLNVDSSRNITYCVDDDNYCVGLYSTREDAEARAKELETELLARGYDPNDDYKLRFEIEIMKIPVDKRTDLDFDESGNIDIDIAVENGMYLGGGIYYE